MNEIKKLMLNQSIQTNIEANASMRDGYDEKQKLRLEKMEERYQKIETEESDLFCDLKKIGQKESVNQMLEYGENLISRLEEIKND